MDKGGLACCSPWGRRVTYDWVTELNWTASLSHVRLLATPWTVARQAPLSMGILQAGILEWVATPSSRDLPNPGIKPRSPTLQVDSLPSEPPAVLFWNWKFFFFFFWSDRFVVYVVSFNTLFLRYHECSDVVYILLCFFVLYWGVHAYLLYFWHKPFFQRLFFRALLCLQDWEEGIEICLIPPPHTRT